MHTNKRDKEERQELIMFCDVIQIRKGILPRLLEEILSTRIMVKQAMKKLSPSQQVLHKVCLYCRIKLVSVEVGSIYGSI